MSQRPWVIPWPSAQRSGAGLPPPSPPLEKWFISWEIVKYGTWKGYDGIYIYIFLLPTNDYTSDGVTGIYIYSNLPANKELEQCFQACIDAVSLICSKFPTVLSIRAGAILELDGVCPKTGWSCRASWHLHIFMWLRFWGPTNVPRNVRLIDILGIFTFYFHVLLYNEKYGN